MSDIHHFKERVERKIEKVKASSELQENNKKTILSFINECYAERLCAGRIYKLLYSILTLEKMLGKDFQQAEKEDLKELIRKIDSSPKNYTENTKKDFRVVIKKFYKFLNGNEEYPDKVRWIKTTEKNNERKLPEDLLTQDEVRSMIQAADNPRDKALIFTLYEGGLRCGELIGTKLKHVQFDKYGAQMIVSGKTGARRIRLITSCDYLRYWIENHPNRADPESYLWVRMSNTGKGEMLGYASVRKKIKVIAEKAGIRKKVNPHNFRHSRATHLANKLKTSQLNVMFGWAQHSRMPSTYIHLSGEDVDDALLKMHGLKKENDTETISCPRCNTQSNSMSKYCENCGVPMTLQAFHAAEDERNKYDEKLNKLMDDPDVKKAIMKALQNTS